MLNNEAPCLSLCSILQVYKIFHQVSQDEHVCPLSCRPCLHFTMQQYLAVKFFLYASLSCCYAFRSLSLTPSYSYLFSNQYVFLCISVLCLLRLLMRFCSLSNTSLNAFLVSIPYVFLCLSVFYPMRLLMHLCSLSLTS